MTLSLILTLFYILLYFIIYNFRNKISAYFNVFDIPNEKRKIHKLSTPKTASYSLALFFLSIVILNFFFKFFDNDFSYVLIGSIIIFIIGFIDDRYKLSAFNKTSLISLATFLLCILSENFIINQFYIFTYDFFFSLDGYSVLFTILSVLCLTNALNLADGINGLAVGIIFIWLVFINQIFINDFDIVINIIFISLFLIFIHNYKGKHFLGDAGSLMLSSFIALIVILLYNKSINDPSHLRSSENLLILFLIPVLDMLRLFFKRILNNKNPAGADKEHLHHYLFYKFNNFKALIIYFLLMNIPIIISMLNIVNKVIIILSTILIYILLIYIIKNKNNEKYT